MSLPIVAPVLNFGESITLVVNPGKTSLYVVAQTGATSVTVTPHPYFDLAITGNRDLTIQSKPAAPLNATHYVLLHVSNGDGTVTQTLPILIANNLGIVENITSPSLTPLPLNTALTYQITTDSTATGALHGIYPESLPAGVSVNWFTGTVTGVPPQIDATYFIPLIAGLYKAYAVKRYWILVVGNGGDGRTTGGSGGGGGGGGAGPGTGGGTFSGGRSSDTSRIRYDGDYSVAQLAGQPIFEVPFKADPVPYAYKVTYWQFRANYTGLALGDDGPFGGYYVGVGGFHDVGGGVIAFQREFALIPKTRSEYESYTYSYQIAHEGGGGSDHINEIPVTVTSRIQYDYFLTSDPNSVSLPKAPRAVQDDTIIVKLNGWGNGSLAGREFLAADAVLRCWKGSIYERTQRFVEGIAFQ